jgi:hypothetical protein
MIQLILSRYEPVQQCDQDALKHHRLSLVSATKRQGELGGIPFARSFPLSRCFA